MKFFQNFRNLSQKSSANCVFRPYAQKLTPCIVKLSQTYAKIMDFSNFIKKNLLKVFEIFLAYFWKFFEYFLKLFCKIFEKIFDNLLKIFCEFFEKVFPPPPKKKSWLRP